MIKYIIFLHFVSFLVWSEVNGEYRDFTDNWFNQTIDHFDSANNQTFKQRYWFNDQYFNQTNRSVIFLRISGEDQLWREWMTNGTWITYANHFNGLAVYLEHRYYGNSVPTSNFSVENLRYLSVRQSLEDIANFIANVKIPNNTFTHKPQWIIYSSSYAAQLATWARLNYPHLITGVVASSPPYQTNIVIPQYLNIVANDIKNTSVKCYNTIGQGFAEVEALMNTTEGKANLTRDLNLCTPLNESMGKYELQDLIVQLQSDYAVLAQSNLVNRMSYTSEEQRQNRSLKHICGIITDNSTNKSALARLNDVAQFVRGGDCLYYGLASQIEGLQDVTNSDRAWLWQMCNEFGNIQIQSNGSSKIFGTIVEVGYFTSTCSGVFGDWLDVSRQKAGAKHIVLSFGARKLNITNTVFLYGTFDPWHNLGILKSNNINSPVILINGTSHGADEFPAAADDPTGLTNARSRVQGLIASWLH